ncbi:Linoleate 9/13-lipoxygenase [Diplonema papillatum]|nr:Linoleate 9/13-lipoxygenase [Diplonema papillatum]
MNALVAMSLLLQTAAGLPSPPFTLPGVKQPLAAFEDIREEIRDRRYNVSFDTMLPGIAMLGGNPPADELPSWAWLHKVLNKTAIIAHSYLDSEQSRLILAAIPGITEHVLHRRAEDAVEKLHSVVDKARGVLTASGAFELAWEITVAERTLQRHLEKNDGERHQSGRPSHGIAASPGGDRSLVKGTVAKLLDAVFTAFVAPANARPTAYEGYSKLFDPLLGQYPEPQSNREAGVDEAFARYRLAGWVPFQLRKADAQLLQDMRLGEYRGNSSGLVGRAEKAMAEGRLYGTDYSYIASLPRQAGKFAPRPVGLFEIPVDEEEGARVGVQALCVQVTKGVASSIFAPADGEWAWKYAKIAFNAMESVFHEGVGHLAHTHLVVEAILLSLKRSLSRGHPLRKLVDPHLEGTVFINWLAEQTLLRNGGPVDIQFPTEIGATRAFIADNVLERLQQNLTWPAFMAAAGLTEEQFPVKYYPYRDYAGKLWKAYHRWVSRYLRVVYPTDEVLNADRHLESFRRQLIANKVRWVEDTWVQGKGTVDLLVDVVASCIFIGSAQHAAVNFAQEQTMSPAGFVPRALYSPPQNEAEFLRFERDVLNALPPIRQSSLQRDVMLILSTQYTNMVDGYAKPRFEHPEMTRAAHDFQQDLVAIERYQNEKNEQIVGRWRSVDKPEGLDPDHWAYTLLLPSQIPMSINI